MTIVTTRPIFRPEVLPLGFGMETFDGWSADTGERCLIVRIWCEHGARERQFSDRDFLYKVDVIRIWVAAAVKTFDCGCSTNAAA